jgi:hypothetical protein
MATLQDRATLQAAAAAALANNTSKDISAADVRDQILNMAESVIFYNENQQKENVLLATTANITLSGEQTIDGTLTSASDVLVKDQSTPAENGIYITGAGAWTRRTDFDSDDDIELGNIVYVTSGTANGSKYFFLTVGATLAANKTFTVLGASLDISGLSAFSGTVDGAADKVAMYDDSAAANKSIIMSRLVPTYGTFTPGIAFGGGTTGITYSTQEGSYVEAVLNDGKYKIEFTAKVEISNAGSDSGDLTLTGLPRTSMTTRDFVVQTLFDDASGASSWLNGGSQDDANWVSYIPRNTTTIVFYKYDIENGGAITQTDVGVTTGTIYMLVTGWYISG